MPKAITSVRANRLERSHLELIQRLSVLFPHQIVGGPADTADVEARIDHLRAIFRAVLDYEQAVIEDTAAQIVGGRRGEIVQHLWDGISDDDDWVVAALERAGCRLDLAFGTDVPNREKLSEGQAEAA
jgi:hypothetical protein